MVFARNHVGLLLGALATYAAAALYVYDFTLDDAGITLRYAYNLAHAGALSFNVDNRVYGTTTIAWALLLTPIMAVVGNGDPTPACKAASFLCGALCVAGFVYVSRSWQLLVRVLFVAFAMLSTTFIAFAFSAMEFSLSILLLVVYVALYLERDGAHRASRMAWVAIALFFTRPDFTLITVPLFLHVVLTTPADWRKWAPTLVPPAIAAAACLLAIAWYYGSPIPLTFKAKILDEAREPGILPGLRRVLSWAGVQGLLPLYLVALYAFTRRAHVRQVVAIEHKVLALVGLLFLAYFVREGGSIVMDHVGRYYYPGLLLLAWASCAVVDAAMEERTVRWTSLTLLPLSASLLLAAVYVGKHHDMNLFTKSKRYSLQAYGDNLRLAYFPLGRYIESHYQRRTTLLLHDAGFIPLYSRLDRVLDYWSLNEPRIIDCKRACTAEVIKEFDPDLVVQGHHFVPQFRKHYRVVQRFKGADRTLTLFEKKDLAEALRR